MNRIRLFAVCGVLLPVAASARPAVTYTGVAGAIDVRATDTSGVDSDLAVYGGPVSSFDLFADASTPAGTTDIGGAGGVRLYNSAMLLGGELLGGSGVTGAVSGTISMDIYFTLSAARFGFFDTLTLPFDPHPLQVSAFTLTGPGGAIATGPGIFGPGAYHLHGDLSFIGVMASPDTSGHFLGLAGVEFVPMPSAAGLAGAGLFGLVAVRRRRG